jgi:LysM repeat protein
VNTVKSVVVVGVLAIVGFGLWQGLNNGFQFNNAPPLPDGWDAPTGGLTPPTVDLGGQQPVGSQTIAPTPGAGPPNAQASLGNAAPFNTTYGDPATAPAPTDVTPNAAAFQNPPNVGADTTNPINSGLPNGQGQTYQPQGTAESASLTPGISGLPAPNAGAPFVAPAVGVDPLANTGVALQPKTDTGVNATGQSAFNAAFASAQEQLRRGQLSTALLTLSIWYEDSRLSEQDHQKLVALLDQLAGTVIYSTKPLLEPAYRVRAGDRLESIAQRYKVPAGLLAKINGVADPNNLTPNQELKVVNGPFNAVINTKKNVLTLFLGGRYSGRFMISCGPEFEGIIGQFVVKSKNPSHSAHNGFPWIELGHGYSPSAPTARTPQQIGLAGMTAPAQAITGSVPGRIGVSARDADDLFDLLSQGSKVTIRR